MRYAKTFTGLHGINTSKPFTARKLKQPIYYVNNRFRKVRSSPNDGYGLHG